MTAAVERTVQIRNKQMNIQYPSKLLEMPEGALVIYGKLRFFKVRFFLNKAVAPFIFNELYRVPHLE